MTAKDLLCLQRNCPQNQTWNVSKMCASIHFAL